MQPLDCRRLRSQRGGIVLRFLLFCAFLFVLATIAGVNLLRGIHIRTAQRNGADDVAVETPAGSLHIRAHEKLDPSLLDIPAYPGARRTDSSGGAEFDWVSANGDEKGLTVGGAAFVTPDPPEKVVDFYKDQLSNLVVVHEKHKAVRLETTEGGIRRIIAIHEKADGTHIGVAAIGGPASN